MLGILVGEDAKQILDEFSDLISVFAVRVDLLQMGYHVHNIDETVVKNDLLLLEFLDQIVDLIDGAFAVDAGISFRNDGVGLLLTQKDVLCRGTLDNLQRTRSAQLICRNEMSKNNLWLVQRKDMPWSFQVAKCSCCNIL